MDKSFTKRKLINDQVKNSNDQVQIKNKKMMMKKER
jgi:hypothetical protein